jgi:coenzyme F420-0:L-glutamate ligase/coenzyme F420-1:gamma-L-glutamate ligase
VTVELHAVTGMPEIKPGDNLAALMSSGAQTLQSGDVVVVAQKVVSKAEGRLVNLSSVNVSSRAQDLADSLGADPRLVQVILGESVRIVRQDRVLIVETRHGFVCANAGVDQSNLPGEEVVSLLPLDCDRSAQDLRNRIAALTGVDVAVIISDTFGRPWRLGLTNVALGLAGMPALIDHRGLRDDFDVPMRSTVVAIADEIAAAAGLIMGKSRRIPAVIVRGLDPTDAGQGAGHDLIRPPAFDLFR